MLREWEEGRELELGMVYIMKKDSFSFLKDKYINKRTKTNVNFFFTLCISVTLCVNALPLYMSVHYLYS